MRRKSRASSLFVRATRDARLFASSSSLHLGTLALYNPKMRRERSMEVEAINVFASPPRATALKSAATDVTALLCEPLSSSTLARPFAFHTRTTPSAVPPSAVKDVRGSESNCEQDSRNM